MSKVIEHLIEQEIARAEKQDSYISTALVASIADGMITVATVMQAISYEQQDAYIARLNAARAKAFGRKVA